MLIGSRSQPRPPKPQSHRLALTPVIGSGRCGWSSGTRLAGSCVDGQLRLAGRPAIPRGGGCGPRGGPRAALTPAVGPRGRWAAAGGCRSDCRLLVLASGSRRCRSTFERPVAPSACGSRHLPQRDGFHRGVAVRQRCLQGRGGARSRGLTSPPGLRGVGAAALRLTCSGGGNAGEGAAPPMRTRFAWAPAALHAAASVPTPAPAPGGLCRDRLRAGPRTRSSRVAVLVLAGREALLPSLQARLRFQKNEKRTDLGEKTWKKLYSPHSFTRSFALSFIHQSSLRERDCERFLGI